MIGLVRLLLRGLLLLLLAIAGGWVATGFTERMFFVGASAALVAGIYFVTAVAVRRLLNFVGARLIFRR